MTFNPMAVRCQTVSLGYVLIDYAFSAAILIAHGDLNGSNKNSLDGMCSAAKSGGYCTMKTTPLIKTLALRVLQQPLMPAIPVQ